MKKMQQERILRLWLFFAISLMICLGVTTLYIKSQMQVEQSQMEQIAMSKANKVNTVLSKLLYKTQVLSAIVVQNNGEVLDFFNVATTIFDDPSIKNLILAPDGIVTYVYPLDGNEKVLGLDYFSEKNGNKEAILAKETGQLVLGGPFDLVQGGQALVGRLPIYTSNQDFWGLAAVTLDYPQALADADLDQLKSQGFAYEIWRINPDSNERQSISSSGYSYNKNTNYVEYPMNILNAQWYFRLSPMRLWYQFPETWIFIGIGSLISFLIGLLMAHNFDLNKMKEEFERLSFIDPLTEILNRRGGFNALQTLQNGRSPFILCFIDLDKFKEVNDKYGHDIGDQFLQTFVLRLRENTNQKSNILARVGGDEFIIVFKNTKDILKMEQWFLQVEDCLLHTHILEEPQSIPISFSMGYSCYPEDGKNIDKLVKIADDRMYNAKRARKKELTQQ